MNNVPVWLLKFAHKNDMIDEVQWRLLLTIENQTITIHKWKDFVWIVFDIGDSSGFGLGGTLNCRFI